MRQDMIRPRQIEMLHPLEAGCQDFMDVNMNEAAGIGIGQQPVRHLRIARPRLAQNFYAAGLGHDFGKRLGIRRRDQHIKVGLARQRRIEVMIALPMRKAHAAPGEQMRQFEAQAQRLRHGVPVE
jgi:hypothetical protein